MNRSAAEVSIPITNSKVLAGLMGVCVGDALGVPVEFTSREERTENPVVDLDSYNAWKEEPGTWSDDSSLTFCLADCLCNGFSLQKIYQAFPYILEKHHFERIFSRKIAALPVESINSEGYVIDTLEASLWCFLTTSSYPEAVLKAVNLGEDTDTTAAVTGGLAGMYYGIENIPSKWVKR